jgi:hypothetical protein
LLDVNGTIGAGTAGGVAIQLANGAAIRNSAAAANTIYFDTSFGSATHGSFEFRSSNAGTTRMLIDSSGRVGIGVNVPQARLDVDGGDIYVRTSGRLLSDTVQGYTGGATPLALSAANTVTISTASTERARIDSSGRLLVGTSTESGNSLLTVRGNTGSSTGAGVIDIGLGTTRPGSAGTALGYLRFTSTSNTGSNYHYAAIYAETDGTSSSDTDIPGRLVFSTTADGASSPTERMRIDNAGQISSFAASATPSYTIRNASTAGTSTVFIQGLYSASSTTSGGTASIYVFTNGDIQNTNNSYTALSDIKLKENVVDANSQWADIKALRVRNYNLKEGQTHKQIGLVAQEVEPISPGLVYETPDRDADGNDLGTTTKAVQYSVLYMKAVKALQEAMKRIEQLETEMAEVKTQLQAS